MIEPNPFSETEIRILARILENIIPADSSRDLPSAADVDVLGFIQEYDLNYLPRLQHEIDQLEDSAKIHHGCAFLELEDHVQSQLLSSIREQEPGMFRTLATWTVICYYQDDQVMTSIGLPAQPPFPKGYEVNPGDLQLLDPVRSRGKLFRDA